jgi:hypothetical protein
MSVLGRNAVRGSTLTVYRPTKANSTGGQVSVTWAAVLSAIKWEMYTLTQEVLRQIFGADSEVDVVAFAAHDTDVRLEDGVVVTAGTWVSNNFRVVKLRRSRKYLEIGLRKTAEVIS